MAKTQPIHNKNQISMNQAKDAGKNQNLSASNNSSHNRNASQNQAKNVSVPVEISGGSPKKDTSLNMNKSLNNTQNSVGIVKNSQDGSQKIPQPAAQAADDDDEYYGDEYYEEEEEEEEDEKANKPQQPADKFETVSSDSMQKIRKIVESQAKIPRIIVIKDQHGIEQEYEVLEESEEEDDLADGSINLSVSLGRDTKNLKVTSKGRTTGTDELSSRRRVLIDGDDMGDESFYIEEIIEESEEESDEMDNFGRSIGAGSAATLSINQMGSRNGGNYGPR